MYLYPSTNSLLFKIRGQQLNVDRKDSSSRGTLCVTHSLFLFNQRHKPFTNFIVDFFSWVNRRHVQQHCFVYAYYIPTNLPFWLQWLKGDILFFGWDVWTKNTIGQTPYTIKKYFIKSLSFFSWHEFCRQSFLNHYKKDMKCNRMNICCGYISIK